MRKGRFLASVLLLAVPALAAEDGGPDDPGRFRVGVNLGIISIPRPINVEGYARLHPYIGVSGGWSTFPKFASDAILSWAGAKSDTTVSSLNRFDAWEVALRVYPLRGSFFLGVGVGQQVIDAVVTEKQAGSPIGLGGSARESTTRWPSRVRRFSCIAGRERRSGARVRGGGPMLQRHRSRKNPVRP